MMQNWSLSGRSVLVARWWSTNHHLSPETFFSLLRQIFIQFHSKNIFVFKFLSMMMTQPYTNHSSPNNDLRIVLCGEPSNIAPPSETIFYNFKFIRFTNASIKNNYRPTSPGDDDTNWFSQPFAVVDPRIRPLSTIEVSDGAITLLFP